MNRKSAFIILLFLAAVYSPLFLHLDSASIRLWDESLNSVNALEMAENHQYLVRYFNGVPDMWHTKPPLVTWTQVISMNIVGFGELGLRLPIAMAALFTTLALLWFGKRSLGNWESGFFAGLILVTISGYTNNHVARTGDVDGFLVLFSSLFALAFFNYMHGPPERRNRYLIYAVIAMIMGIMSKGIAIFLILPGILIYIIWKGQLKPILKRPKVYIGMAIALLVPLTYYFLREGQNPGYLKAVWENELGGRFFATVEHHTGSVFYYLEHLWKGRFAYWIFLLLPLVLLGFRHSLEAARKFMRFGLCFSLTYLLVISVSKTKLEWYDAPLFPIVAMLMGIGLSSLWEKIQPALKLNNKLKEYGAVAMFSLAVFGAPYQSILHKVVRTEKGKWQPERIGYIVKDWKKKKPNLKKYTLVFYGHPSIINSYKIIAEHNSDYDVRVAHNRHLHTLKTNEIVLVCEDSSYEQIQEDYNYEVQDSTWYGCRELRILGEKSED